MYEIRLRRDGMIVEIEYEKQFWVLNSNKYKKIEKIKRGSNCWTLFYTDFKKSSLRSIILAYDWKYIPNWISTSIREELNTMVIQETFYESCKLLCITIKL